MDLNKFRNPFKGEDDGSTDATEIEIPNNFERINITHGNGDSSIYLEKIENGYVTTTEEYNKSSGYRSKRVYSVTAPKLIKA